MSDFNKQEYLDFATEVGDSKQSMRRRAATSIRVLAVRVEELQAENQRLLDERDAIAINAEAQLAEEAKAYVSLSNKLVAGELVGERVEGSILDESIYVDTRIKDVQDPLFQSLKDRLDAFKLEQQAKGVEKAADVREINWSKGDRNTLMLLANQLRQQAEEKE